MKEKLGLMFGLVLFVIIISGMIYLIAVSRGSGEAEVFTRIGLSGNSLLTASDYLMSTNLSGKVDYSELTLPVIKSRIEHHPYVKRAEVQTDGSGKVLIKIFEKKMKALILTGSVPELVTEGFELVKLEKNTDITDLPVISNVNLKKRERPGISVNSVELKRAFKIIDAMYFTNESMYKNLAEINLRYGGDIVLTFSGIDYPVIFGKGNEVKKIIKLSAIWKKLINKDKLFANSKYVDLRFNSEIFIGKPVTAELNG